MKPRLKYNPHQHHRRSIRLKGYDYSLPGAYFITILTYKRIEIFGEVVGGEMRLNSFGNIAKDEWFHTANLRPAIYLDPNEMVIMPNHIHGIIWINEMDTVDDRKGAASLRPYTYTLGVIVRAYKAAVTYRINASRNSRGIPVWHRGYYDHIIRNVGELRKICEYIDTNPQKWEEDFLFIK